MMMTVYTGINVPYGAMLGVMTDDPNEKTVFSSFRMFFAYGGSFLALFLWEPLTNMFGGYKTPDGWFYSMCVIASVCFVMFILCFLLTKEHLKTVSTVSVGSDFKSLLSNKPGGCSSVRRCVRTSSIRCAVRRWPTSSSTSSVRM